MRSLRRWTAGVLSRCDAMVTRIENHDGLVSAAIREAREARARARVQLGRVHRDGQRMQRRLSELERDALRWRERAVRVAASDEPRALECLSRGKRAERERAALEAQRREHDRTEEQLRRDMSRVDERIAQLEQRRNLLRTRQSRAQALTAAQSDDHCLLSDVQEIFDRWETVVMTCELEGDCPVGEGDDLERDFEAVEEAGALRAELDELLQREGEGA